MSAGQLTTAEAIALARVCARDLGPLAVTAARVAVFGAHIERLGDLALVEVLADGRDLAATPWAKFDWPGA